MLVNDPVLILLLDYLFFLCVFVLLLFFEALSFFIVAMAS